MDFLGLSKVLIPILEFFNGMFHNYGVSIIFFTLLIKLILLPLDLKQRKSMRRMSSIQPEVQKLNKKYANDPAKKNQKVAELYKKEKISPLGGCLPMLIQWPVLIALFAVLNTIAAQQMQHIYELVVSGDWAGFEQIMSESNFLWIRNMWQPDSFINPQGYILPIELVNMSLPAEVVNGWAAAREAVMARYGDLYASKAALENLLLWPANGLLILPVVSAVGQFLQTKLMSKNQPQQLKPDGTPKGKWMTYLFPALTLFLCATYNAAFAIYWFMSSVISVVTYFVYDYVQKRKETVAKLDQEQEWGKLGQ